MALEKMTNIGLAVVGCGTIGRIRAGFAQYYPGVEWLGLCDIKEDLGKKLAEDTQADFFTTDVQGWANLGIAKYNAVITNFNFDNFSHAILSAALDFSFLDSPRCVGDVRMTDANASTEQF